MQGHRGGAPCLTGGEAAPPWGLAEWWSAYRWTTSVPRIPNCSWPGMVQMNRY